MSCSFPGCGRNLYAKGWCEGHWKQDRRGGPLRPLRADRAPRRLVHIRVAEPVAEAVDRDRDGAAAVLARWAGRK